MSSFHFILFFLYSSFFLCVSFFALYNHEITLKNHNNNNQDFFLFISCHCDSETLQSVMRISPKTVCLCCCSSTCDQIEYYIIVLCSNTRVARERREGERVCVCLRVKERNRQSKRIESKILLSMSNKSHETKISGFYSV